MNFGLRYSRHRYCRHSSYSMNNKYKNDLIENIKNFPNKWSYFNYGLFNYFYKNLELKSPSRPYLVEQTKCYLDLSVAYNGLVGYSFH